MGRSFALRVVADMHDGDQEPPMHIDWDVAIAMDDGIVLRADVFRPPATAAIRSS